LVSDICNLLPYGSGVWQYALIFFSNNTFIVSIDYFFCFKYNFYLIGIDKAEWSTIQACLICFRTGAVLMGLTLRQFLFYVCVYILLLFFVFGFGFWFCVVFSN